MANLTLNNLDNAHGIVRQSFTFATRFAASASITSVSFDPVNSSTLFGAEVSNLANLFQEYRCINFKLIIYPAKSEAVANGSSDTGLAVGWRPMKSASGASTAANVMASAKSVYVTDSLTEPIVFTIGRKQLMKAMLTKWLHVDTSPFSDTCTHGTIDYIAQGTNSSSAIWTWVVQSTWEFQCPVPFGQFLANRRLFPDLSPSSELIGESKSGDPACMIARRALDPDPESKSQDVVVVEEADPLVHLSSSSSQGSQAPRSSTVGSGARISYLEALSRALSRV